MAAAAAAMPDGLQPPPDHEPKGILFKQMRAKLSPRKPTSFAKYGVTSQWSGITV